MEKTFDIIPATGGIYVFVWGFSIFILVVCLGVIGLLASFGYQAKNATFTLTDQGLRIGPGLYGRTIPKQNIIAESVRVIDLNVEKSYQPKWKTNGANFPGYSAGWFKLQNNEKALLFVTDRSRVVYIPTTENYSVMLSVKEAEEFADILQHWQ